MPKNEKVKVNVRERVDDNVCDLSLSGLNEIPVREINSFKRVTVLDLSSNCLTTLGKNFIVLTRLVKIDLSKNQIKYLPDDFGLLRNLRHLDLYDNKLEHLPLSFGNLNNLRYLDLKGNPLAPALAKIVGFCLTTKQCQDSARNTVKFLERMQVEAERAKDLLKLEAQISEVGSSDELLRLPSLEDKLTTDAQKPKKSANKKGKSKNKKSNNHNNNNNEMLQEIRTTSSNPSNKTSKSKKNTNGVSKKSVSKSSTALTTVFTFFVLLAINVVIIYMIMFKNPEVADKLVEFIPHQYRDWILTKTEIFRLQVTDWISEFRTPPQEH